MTAPPIGLTTEAKVKRVIDGDTLEVELTRNVHVRLKDCWAPELRNEGGPEAKKQLERLIGLKPVIVHIPGDAEGDIRDIFTFGRVVGVVFVDDTNVSEQMVADGYATKEKP